VNNNFYVMLMYAHVSHVGIVMLLEIKLSICKWPYETKGEIIFQKSFLNGIIKTEVQY